MELQDFFPYYPPRTDPALQQLILNKKEFSDLKLGAFETQLPTKSFMNSQKIVQRFTSEYTLYDEMVVYHETGSGKSGVAFAITEQLRGSGSFQRAFILAKSHDLLNALMKALVYQFSSRYITPGPDVVNQLSFLRKQVSDFYTFKTTETFAKDFSSMDDEQVRSLFSNSVFILDEAHDLSPPGSEGTATNLYAAFKRLFRVTENRKVVLMSGTPMKDVVEDIAILFNLILKPEEQLPEGKQFREVFVDDRRLEKSANNAVDVQLKNVDQLKQRMMGRITFLLAPPFHSISRKFMGEPLSSQVTVEQFRLVHELMTDIQLGGYRNAMNVDKSRSGDAPSSSFYTHSVQASLLVFPDGSWGDGGYKLNTNRGEFLPEVKKTLGDINSLRNHSVKYHALIQGMLERPKELFYAYCSKIRGSGVLALAKILQLYGYQPLRAGGNKSKGRRYIVLTSETDNVNKYIEYYNHPRNRHGEYCQLLIGSKKISQGFTFKNVLNIHILTLHWNYTETHQAIHRAYRYGSHQALVSDDKQYVVKIYQHCAVDPERIAPSIDRTMMVFSYTKDVLCRKMDRVIKEISFDCPLTIDRNRRTGEPFSRTCDYLESCEYTCDQSSEKVEEADWSTYYLYNNIDVEIIDLLTRLFQTTSSLTFSSIQDLTKTPFFQLVKNLNTMIEYNIPIKLATGTVCYLREDNNMYYLVNDIVLGNGRPQLQTYIQKPLFTQTKTLTDALEELEETQFKSLLKDIKTSTLEVVPDLIERMTVDQKLFFFKRMCELRFIDNHDNRLIQFLLQQYPNVVLAGTNEYLCAVSVEGRAMQCLDATRVWADDCSAVNLQKLMYENPYGFYGIVDPKTDKFGIRDVRDLGAGGKKSRQKRGSICGESGWKKAELVQMYIDLVPTPNASMLVKINELFMKHGGVVPNKMYKIAPFAALDAEPVSTQQKTDRKWYFMAVHGYTVSTICAMLRSAFESLELVVRDSIGTARRSVVV